jgi:hypothetical protein
MKSPTGALTSTVVGASVRGDTVDPFGDGGAIASDNERGWMAWRTTPRAFLNGIDRE